MRIGIVSDTHGLLRREVIEGFQYDILIVF